jgi:drug/metabolite transporter (DMT)-like permease
MILITIGLLNQIKVHYDGLDYNIYHNKLNAVGYICPFILASFIYSYGSVYAHNTISTGAYVAISSCYPIITFIISYLFESSTNVDLNRTLIGISCIVVGIGILSTASK